MSRHHRIVRILAWILAVLLAASFLMSAGPKLAPGESMVARFEAWGYPDWFPRVVGTMEGLGALLLLLPATALYGSVLLVVVMAGATGTHLLTGIGSPAFSLLYLALAVVVGFLRRHDAWHKGRSTTA